MPDRAYQVITTRTAEKELLELPPRISRQLERSIDRIQAFFQLGQPLQDMRPLRGRRNTFRVDSGEYRILFQVDEENQLVTIFRVRHRRTAYRNL